LSLSPQFFKGRLHYKLGWAYLIMQNLCATNGSLT
jgi:hypothetical protein